MLASLNSTAQVMTIVASIVATLGGVVAIARWISTQIKETIRNEVAKAAQFGNVNTYMLAEQNRHFGLPLPPLPPPLADESEPVVAPKS